MTRFNDGKPLKQILVKLLGDSLSSIILINNLLAENQTSKAWQSNCLPILRILNSKFSFRSVSSRRYLNTAAHKSEIVYFRTYCLNHFESIPVTQRNTQLAAQIAKLSFIVAQILVNHSSPSALYRMSGRQEFTELNNFMNENHLNTGAIAHKWSRVLDRAEKAVNEKQTTCVTRCTIA